jgi:excinuclease UvrABC helicase subunit UvrB
MQRTYREHVMKTATLPSLRVQPELREAAESVLREGETLTSLMETAMRETIHKRRTQDEFNARAQRASEEAKRTGVYYSAKEVHDELQRRLDARRKELLNK